METKENRNLREKAHHQANINNACSVKVEKVWRFYNINKTVKQIKKNLGHAKRWKWGGGGGGIRSLKQTKKDGTCQELLIPPFEASNDKISWLKQVVLSLLLERLPLKQNSDERKREKQPTMKKVHHHRVGFILLVTCRLVRLSSFLVLCFIFGIGHGCGWTPDFGPRWSRKLSRQAQGFTV